MNRTDEELIAMCAGGDIEAFEALYDRHARVVFGVSVVQTGSRETAEEVAQDVFLALWRFAASFDRTRASVRTWLLAITRNLVIDRKRRDAAEARANRGWIAREPSADKDPVGDLIVATAAAKDLHHALAALPGMHRAVIERSFIADSSHSEIADELGIPIGTVKSRARLGLARLRETMAA